MSDAVTWRDHVERWQDGCGSKLCQRANRVVLARGQIPCDVLFYGEAPGAGENLIGLPFVGPAGKLLDRIVAESVPKSLRVALTNLVGCLPTDEDGSKVEPPEWEDVEACRPRLNEFIELCRPKLVVGVGRIPEACLDQGARGAVEVPDGCLVVSILHPAFILRQDPSQRPSLVQRQVARIRESVEKMT